MNIKHFQALLIVIFIFACKHFTPLVTTCNHLPVSIELEEVLARSGNYDELNKVLDHYGKDPSDSMKFKAASFYILNLENFYYYEGKLLEQYNEYSKLVLRDRYHGEYIFKSLNILYGPFLYSKIDKKYDIKEIKACQLEDNIDMAFKVWREQPWGKNISFDQFCEYILPFRIMNELPEYNRNKIYEQFNGFLDSVIKVRGSSEDACSVLNTILMKPQWLLSHRTTFLPHSRASELIKYHVGSCREMTDLSFFAMRAVGIPVAIDFIPQWADRDNGHEFNAVLGKNGKMTMFLGEEVNPGTPDRPLTKKGKIYRNLFEKNPNSLAMVKDYKDIVPSFLNNPRIKDVTDEYVSCRNITVSLINCPSLQDRNKKYAYITVFDNSKWVPIHWGTVQKNKVYFTKMEVGIVYMACYYEDSKIIPASYPFILKKNGEIKYLHPDKRNVNKNICISRVFPLITDAFDTWHMAGCKFQGANSPDFHSAIDLYTIPIKPNPFWNEIKLNTNQQFRYVRYFSIGYTHIGELEFYFSGTKLEGKPSGTRIGRFQNKDKTFDKAVDGDINTSFDPFDRRDDSCTWVGLDFGKRKNIDKIRFSAPLKEDKVEIVIGHIYNLFYWDNGIWISAGIRSAKTQEACFENIPSKALYYIQDRTEHVKCRIFTYDKNKPIWW